MDYETIGRAAFYLEILLGCFSGLFIFRTLHMILSALGGNMDSTLFSKKIKINAVAFILCLCIAGIIEYIRGFYF